MFETVLNLLSRRQFMKAATAGTALSTTTVFSRTQKSVGKKGQVYPDQRRKYADSKTGASVWQLTDTPGRTTQTLYWTNRHVTPDSRYLIYVSDHASEGAKQFNLFQMDLNSGESIQLTDSGKVVPHSPDISRDGQELYFVEDGNVVKAVRLDSLEERILCHLEERVEIDHAITVNATNRLIIAPAELEPKRRGGYQYPPYAHRMALALIDLQTGKWHYMIDGNAPLGHVAFNPKDPDLVLYSYHARWYEIQRPWLIKTDGSGNRSIFPAHNGEAIGHEFWGDGGENVYVSCFCGRQPQGMWLTDLRGNEGCVLKGSSIAHNAVNPEEDRFVVDELYHETDSLWMSRKNAIEPERLCQLADDWWVGPERSGPDHPHARFLPNGQGVTYSSAGEVYLVEV